MKTAFCLRRTRRGCIELQRRLDARRAKVEHGSDSRLGHRVDTIELEMTLRSEVV